MQDGLGTGISNLTASQSPLTFTRHPDRMSAVPVQICEIHGLLTEPFLIPFFPPD